MVWFRLRFVEWFKFFVFSVQAVLLGKWFSLYGAGSGSRFLSGSGSPLRALEKGSDGSGSGSWAILH